MALLNEKSPLNNPIFTGVVKQLFGGRGAVPLLVEPSDWTDTLKNYIISKSPPTNLTDYAKTSDSDIWNYGHYFEEQFQITKIAENGERNGTVNNIKGTFTLLKRIKKIGKIVLCFMRNSFGAYEFTEKYEFTINRFYVYLETQKYNQVSWIFELEFGSKLASLLNIEPIITQSTHQDSYEGQHLHAREAAFFDIDFTNNSYGNVFDQVKQYFLSKTRTYPPIIVGTGSAGDKTYNEYNVSSESYGNGTYELTASGGNVDNILNYGDLPSYNTN